MYKQVTSEFDKAFAIIKELMNRVEALEQRLIDVTYLKTYTQEPEKPKECKQEEVKESTLLSVLKKLEYDSFVASGVDNIEDFVKEIRQLAIEKVKEVAKDTYEPNLHKYIEKLEEM